MIFFVEPDDMKVSKGNIMRKLSLRSIFIIASFAIVLLTIALVWFRHHRANSVNGILNRIRTHNFEQNSGYSGVADLDDIAWKVRTLVIRDLVIAGQKKPEDIITALNDEDRHVRQVCVKTAGILDLDQAGETLLGLLAKDSDPIVRGDAAQSLAQIEYGPSAALLEKLAKEEKDKNLSHRCTLALERLQTAATDTETLKQTWASIDEDNFKKIRVGKKAPDFELEDTSTKTWSLSYFKGKKTVVLLWIFADWCPVCQGEFRDLTTMEKQFKDAGVQVMTIECHDRHRCKHMVAGRDLWWPHLVDVAGKVGATYGVDPMEFVVHDEWINRPSTIIIDKKGKVKFAYYGTFWGDRPNIKETLEMIKTEKYEFRHPERRELKIIQTPE